jgi:uncharacterized protein (TIGR02246 family)
MARVAQFVFTALMLMSPALALAGPSEDANATVDRWSAAYSTNDPEAVANNYWSDAILLGTVSPVMSEGTQVIVKYFTPIKGTGNKNAIEERRTIVIGDNAVVVTGFYTFARMVEGKPVPGPSRFTMLVTKRGSEWRLAHHHSFATRADEELKPLGIEARRCWRLIAASPLTRASRPFADTNS